MASCCCSCCSEVDDPDAEDDVDEEGDDDEESLRGVGPRQSASLVEAGAQFNRKILGLSFGLKNELRFYFDSETCLNYPFSKHFPSVGNLEPKLK